MREHPDDPPDREDRIADIIDGCTGSTTDMALAIAELQALGMDAGEASNTLCEVLDAGITYAAWIRRQRGLV